MQKSSLFKNRKSLPKSKSVAKKHPNLISTTSNRQSNYKYAQRQFSLTAPAQKLKLNHEQQTGGVISMTNNGIQRINYCEQYNTFIFDVDGVLWDRYQFYSFAIPTLQHLQSKKKKILIATNNSTKPRSFYKQIFEENGITIPLRNIYTSSSHAARYYQRNFSPITIPTTTSTLISNDNNENVTNNNTTTNQNDISLSTQSTTTTTTTTTNLPTTASVITIGEQGLEEEFGLIGVKTFPIDTYINELQDPLFIQNNNIKALVQGYKYNFPSTMCQSMMELSQRYQLPLIITAIETFDRCTTTSSQQQQQSQPTQPQSLTQLLNKSQQQYQSTLLSDQQQQQQQQQPIYVPSLFSTPLTNCSYNSCVHCIPLDDPKRPITSLGKPSKDLFDTIIEDHNDLIQSTTLMIGDTLSTDIVFGNRNNIDTLLVMNNANRTTLLQLLNTIHSEHIMTIDSKGKPRQFNDEKLMLRPTHVETDIRALVM